MSQYVRPTKSETNKFLISTQIKCTSIVQNVLVCTSTNLTIKGNHKLDIQNGYSVACKLQLMTHSTWF